MVSTTGEHAAWFELDADLKPREAEIPTAVRTVVERIGANCEPALASVLFMAGAGGTLRAGAPGDPARLTRSASGSLTRRTPGRGPFSDWPGGRVPHRAAMPAIPDSAVGLV